MALSAVTRNEWLRGWALLAALQAVVSLVLFHDFLFGEKYFAFTDVGSDTFAQFVPLAIHLASPANWGSAWSFEVGLGGIALPPVSPFSLLGIAGGPAHVLDLRIWVYLSKVFAAGAAFYGFSKASGARRETAVIAALAYSFCGYMATDGQWDGHATDVVAYALLLWAFAQHSKRPSCWFIPVAVAFSAYSGTFLFSVGVFVVYASIAATIASDQPLATAAAWIREIFPRCLAGLCLAAPVALPLAYQVLDSPRVSGAQAAFTARMRELLTMNDDTTILIEIAGFFHKNLLGAGNQHFGWMNYLESPGFYVGMLPLLLIPQLWRGTQSDRRILVASAIALTSFVTLPAIRYIAFGFGLDYFRINGLWVSILLLVLFIRSMVVVSKFGIGRGLLAGTAVALGVALFQIRTGLFPQPSIAHEIRIAAFGASFLLLLGLLSYRRIQWQTLTAVMTILVAADASVINYPSFNGPREAVTRQTPGYDDPTVDALSFLRARDHGFHRIEKTYNSVSFCDALAQGYMGVKSYWFQSAGIVGFYSDLDLLPRHSQVKNFTNWLPNFGERFALYSLVGVKYIIANKPIGWAGFRKIHEVGGLSVFQNDLALPLGVVYEQQYPRELLARMSPEAKDITMINAAIVDRLRGDVPRVFDARRLLKQGPAWLEENFFTPARLLQRRGMTIEKFSDGHITGAIDSEVPGLLVFSIPFAKGWSVAIDGVEQPVFSANLGMLATDVPRGMHRIELRYALPGLVPGLFIGLVVLLSFGALGMIRLRSPNPAAPRTTA